MLPHSRWIHEAWFLVHCWLRTDGFESGAVYGASSVNALPAGLSASTESIPPPGLR